MKNKHLIYFSGILNITSGGPAGYLANLKEGLDKVTNSKIDFFTHSHNEKQVNFIKTIRNNIYKKIKTLMYKNSKVAYLYVNYISNTSKKTVKHFNNFNSLKIEKALIEKIKRENYKTIHCHLIFDAVMLLNTIKIEKLKNPPKILLTTHSPESMVLEKQEELNKLYYSQKNITKILKQIKAIEKNGLYNSDILIFPSKEAMEPYYETIDYFEDFIKTKHVKFIQTGSKQLTTNKSKEDLKKQFNIEPDKKIIVYIGRHNEVKGYDLLVKVGEEILKNRDDIIFLIGGIINPKIPYPKHKNWIELGWVNSAEVISIADLFILPNKRTYFDLVMLEVMSMGVPIIASNTGGNKTIKAQCDSIILFNNTCKDLFEKIDNFIKLSNNEIIKIKNNILKTYLKNYTQEHFAKNYINLIDNIHNDL